MKWIILITEVLLYRCAKIYILKICLSSTRLLENLLKRRIIYVVKWTFWLFGIPILISGKNSTFPNIDTHLLEPQIVWSNKIHRWTVIFFIHIIVAGFLWTKNMLKNCSWHPVSYLEEIWHTFPLGSAYENTYQMSLCDTHGRWIEDYENKQMERWI